MCNVRMIRTEPGLVSIPLEKAVYCENCMMVSSSARQRCGLCGSEEDRPNGSVDPRAVGPGSGSCARLGRVASRPQRASIRHASIQRESRIPPGYMGVFQE